VHRSGYLTGKGATAGSKLLSGLVVFVAALAAVSVVVHTNNGAIVNGD